ncbi:MAG: division/cell wall cluster transcriptional repressor MraZ [Desulfuromonas sp.]|nr:division/cell wall cluster transcriptional repressor MraZ [Desulfuromonas thiophila]MDD3801230.1 division/cell wall cluster transcriptional repressor MraZ [Desulfuromonas thiophila]MDY0397414.1 division/cell wall cluster transcriptional repressor MraZ [Desulfuromonas thiophila]
MGFSGEYFNSIDAKGRVSIPARLRSLLQEEFGDDQLIVTRAREALVAYPVSRWSEICAAVDAMPNGPQRDLIYRNRISPAIEAAFDSQGRIALTPSLRQIAGFEKDVVIVGVGEKIELWSQTRFIAQMQASEEQLAGLSSELGALGF